VRPITAVVVAGATALVFGCEGNGSPTEAETPLGCQSLQGSQDVNNWSNCLTFTNGGGGSGTSTGGAGLAPAALYRLVSVNNAPLPFDFGGSEDSLVTADSTRMIDFVLDSSIISLNTDSSVTRIDYIRFRDFRSATRHPPPNFNIPDTLTADTTYGTWSDSTGQPTLELISGLFASNVGYQYTGDTLSADYAYNVMDPNPNTGTTVSGVATFYYQNEGTSFHNVIKYHPQASRASSGTPSPVRQSRVGGAGLSLMRSDDGSGRLVRVIGQ
jgi:hypothetical protein